KGLQVGRVVDGMRPSPRTQDLIMPRKSLVQRGGDGVVDRRTGRFILLHVEERNYRVARGMRETKCFHQGIHHRFGGRSLRNAIGPRVVGTRSSKLVEDELPKR